MNYETRRKLNDFVPRKYQLPIIDAIENKGYKKVLVIMPRRCLAKDTHVTLANGSTKLIQDIKNGDEILSFDGKGVVKDKVKNCWYTGKKEAIEIKSSKFPNIITSKDHKFYSNGTWKKAGELKSCTYLTHQGLIQFNIPSYGKKEVGQYEMYDIETESNHNFFANGYLVHNSGKDVVAWNLAIRQCIKKICIVYYIFPTYSQAKKVIWNSITNEGKRFTDFIPDELISSKNSQEMKVTFTNGSILQLIGSDNIDCFDDQTEILTENGWKLFKDLNKTEKVATLKDGYLEYDKPTAYVDKYYEGDMYKGSGSCLDFLVTPNHRFFLTNEVGGYKFKKVTDIAHRYDTIPSTCKWRGSDSEYFHFNDIYDNKIKLEFFVTILGIFFYSGSVLEHDNKFIRSVLLKPRDEDSRKELEWSLEASNVNYSTNDSTYRLLGDHIYDYFSQLRGRIPKEIKDLQSRYLRILLEKLVGKKIGKLQVKCRTNSKEFVDDIQEVSIKAGYSSVIVNRNNGRLFEITIREARVKRFGFHQRSHITKEYYEGRVYCVSVPSGVIKVRRGGKEIWSGNSIVGTNPYGCVFSEYAIQDPRAYQFIRPILTANNGWALFISCVSPDTLVLSRGGFKRIRNISNSRNEYSDLNKPIFGLDGFNNATDFYYGGKQETLKIALSSGYEIECTPIHPLWNGSEWIKARDIKEGDLIPVQYGQGVFGGGLRIDGFTHKLRVSNGFPINIKNLHFFYLLGLIHADGSYDKNKVTITNKKDKTIRSFLSKVNFKKYGHDDIHYSYGSKSFCSLLEWLGFKHGAKSKTFPDKLFECTKDQLKAFLQGLFDGDGCSHSNSSKRGRVKLTSTCKTFIKELQVVLLNFGIVSSFIKEKKAPTKKVKVYSTIYNLEINGYFAHVFYTQIGFRLRRKQVNYKHVSERAKQGSGNIYPVEKSELDFELVKNEISNPERITRRNIEYLAKKHDSEYLKSMIKEQLFYSTVVSIENSSSEVFDFVIPATHSFFSNGFISHNTPRGRNSFWELYQIALHHPDWFAYKLTLDDTKHIPLKEIEREREEGVMSEDLIQQEYYTSFSLGVEGAYYTKYLDKMRLNGQVGTVPYEVGFKVHTAWDIGVRDSTAIIFFQTIGQTVRFIDCYENSKVGLEHYAKVLAEKDYIYGKHIAPHDIKVKEFGSGMTRLEKAKQMGVKFTVAPGLSIMDGIESVRSMLSKVWIDEVKCAPLIKAIGNYRQEYDSKKKVYKNHPLHDKNSHFCFTGDMEVLTPSGNIKIKNIKNGDEVITPLGIRNVLKVHKRLTNKLCIINDNITCTPEHIIFTDKGLERSDALRYDSILEPYSKLRTFLWKKIFGYYTGEQGLKGFKKTILFLKTKSRSCLMATFIGGMRQNTTWVDRDAKMAEPVMPVKAYIQQFRGIFGKNTKGLSLMGMLFTIKMVILEIIKLITLGCSQGMSTDIYTQQSPTLGANHKNVKTYLEGLQIRQKSGIEVRLEESGIGIMQKILYRRYAKLGIQRFVSRVRKIILRNKRGKNTAAISVKQKQGSYLVSIMKKGIVLFVVKSLSVINTLLRRHVVKSVELKCLNTQEEVYDLTIDIDNCYYINGYLVSNCDSLRYLAISLPKTRDGLTTPEELDKRYRQAVYGEDELPPFFR